MPVKKLSIKKGKKGKLVVHKEADQPVEEEQEELEDDEPPFEYEPPFEPDEEVVDIAESTIVATPTKLKVGKAGKPITAKVSVKEEGSPEEFYEVVPAGAESVVESHKPMANVGYGLDRTINLGDYESLKVHVTLHVPSEVDEEEIEGNYEFCKGWCEQKMEEVVSEYVTEND